MASKNSSRLICYFHMLQQILEFEKLDRFHGTGALNLTHFPSWDSFFLQMMTMHTETVVVEAKEKNYRHQGWSTKAGSLDNLNHNKPEEPASKSAPKNPQPQRPVRGYNNAAYLNNLGNDEIKSTRPKARDDGSSSLLPQASNRGLSSGAGGYLENLSNGNADLPDQEKSEERAKVNPYLEQVRSLFMSASIHSTL
jgi:hypothetical protein